MDALIAAGSGVVAGSMLLVGAVIAWFFKVPPGVIASVTAFGAGVLISALAYELVAEAHADGGLVPTVLGFALGAVIYVGAAALVDKRGGRLRFRPETQATEKGTGQVSPASGTPASGTALLVGALVDGIPESIVLGTTVAATGGLSLPIVLAIAISNLPEGLSSTAGMKAVGRSSGYIFGVWGSVVAVSGVAALLGFVLLQDAPPELIAFITTIAAGGILAMVCNTMIPTAFARDQAFTGLFATLGFLAAFTISHLP
jgi:ZIP family zinc transporter